MNAHQMDTYSELTPYGHIIYSEYMPLWTHKVNTYPMDAHI